MSYNLGLIEKRIFLENELQRYILVIVGVLGVNVLNVQQIAESFLIVLTYFVNQGAVG